MNNPLESLRFLVHGGPSAGTWDAIWSLFGAWPNDESRIVGLTYAQDHMGRWPDALRTGADLGHPAWPLVRQLHVDRAVIDWPALLNDPRLAAITRLSASRSGFDNTALSMLAQLPLAGRLSALILEENPLTEGLDTFIKATSGRLSALEITGSRLGTDSILAALGSEKLSGLRVLTLSDCPVTNHGASVIADAEALSGLTSLTLARASIFGAGLANLASSPYLMALRQLRLPYNSFDDAGIEALSSSRLLHRVESLDLAGSTHYLGDQGLLALAHAPGLRALKKLTLAGGRFSDSVLESLLHSPALLELETLEINQFELTNLDARSLAASPSLNRLQHLVLGANRIDSKGAEWLAEAAFMPDLRSFDFGDGNKAGPTGARALLKALGAVEDLDLSRNRIKDEGIEALAEAEHLTSLRRLNVTNNDLGPASGAVLAECGHLAGLEHLSLSQNGLDDDAVERLAASPHFASLRSLRLSSNPIGDRGYLALLRSPYLGRDLRLSGLYKLSNAALLELLEESRDVPATVQSRSAIVDHLKATLK